MRRTLISFAASLFLVPAAADAQWYNATPTAGRLPVTVEAYYGRLQPAGTQEAYHVDSFGARVLWRLAEEPADRPLLSRAFLGPFGEYMDAEARGFSTAFFGAHGDFRLLSMPLGGVVDPVLSLSAGAVRTSTEIGFGDRPAYANRSNMAMGMAPAVGLRLGLIRGVALRADARDLIVLRAGTQHNRHLSFGVGTTF
jgi:hypothetical protein